MAKNISSKLFYQISFSLIGTFLVALGIRLIVISQLGADALSTFILGILQYIDTSFGNVSLFINALILVVVFFKQRELIGVASIINSFGIGLFINSFDYLQILGSIPQGFQLVSLLIGVELFAMGTAMYLLTDAGSGAYECLMFVVEKWLGKSLRVARMLVDGTLMILGILLGGPFHVGTLLIVLLLGPSLQFYLKMLSKIIKN